MVCRCATPQIHAERAEQSARDSARHTREEAGKQVARLEAALRATTPDPTRYEILEAQPVKLWLVLKVKYPSCTRCEYEGVKVLVFADVTPIDALKWRHLDPHFRPQNQMREAHEAPGPVARFPGTSDGWTDAVAYAKLKTGTP